jgi:2-iminobutanoate/2-iminopropanoate deaminase
MHGRKVLLTCFAIVLAMLACAPNQSFAQKKVAISVGAAPGLPFSEGILVGNTLYISGTEGTDQSGKLKPGGITAETQQALDNIHAILKKAGFEFSDVVSVTVYLADIKDFGEMNKVYRSVMPDPKPTRATIQAAGLVNDARIEISMIAVKEK